MPVRPAVRFAGKLSKAGNAPEECEDDLCSFGPYFAIADGASEGSYSSVWAGILVRSFCDHIVDTQSDDRVSAWLDHCRQQWSAWERELATRDLPWFTLDKLRIGSFATFLGVTITGSEFHALACGDCCLFVVRGDQLVTAFPIESAEAFDNSPRLVSTADAPDPNRFEYCTRALCPGDRLYMVSDALASWFLSRYAEGDEPWISFDFIHTTGDLAMLVDEARVMQKIRNDDVTLLAIHVVE